MIHIVQSCRPRSVCFDVAHVAHMAFCCIGSRVWFVCWIEMGAGGTRVGRAAIAKFVDMKAVVAGSQACNFHLDLHSVGDFYEGNFTADFVACSGMKHSNGF